MRRSRLVSSALVVPIFLAGCSAGGGSESASTPSEPSTLTVSGSITVVGSSFKDRAIKGDDCIATSGYDDIQQGFQLVLANDAGDTLALAELSEGTFVEDSERGVYNAPCSFGFEFVDVPDDEDFYTIEAGTRGSMKYERSDLDEPIELALG